MTIGSTCMWRGGRRVQTQRRTVSPGSTSSGADKEGIADRRPPSRAEEPAQASSRPVPRAGPKPRPSPRPPSAPAARLHHAYDPRASAQAHGGLGWPWAEPRPGPGLGPGLGLGLGPGLFPKQPQNNLKKQHRPKNRTKQTPLKTGLTSLIPNTGLAK